MWERGAGHGGFESGGLEIHTSRRGPHLALHGFPEDMAQNDCEGGRIDNAFQDSDVRGYLKLEMLWA